MTQVYFHCSNTKKVFVDRRGAMVDDLAEARDHAARVVQSLTNERAFEDWRDWVLHVSDDQGDERSSLSRSLSYSASCIEGRHDSPVTLQGHVVLLLLRQEPARCPQADRRS